MTYLFEEFEPGEPAANKRNKRESWLIDQVTKSTFFHQKLHEYGLLEVAYALDRVQGETLNWDLAALGISSHAWNKVIHQGIKPVSVFAHPSVLMDIPRSVGYYRGLAMVSLKSMSNIRLNVERFEAGQNRMPLDDQKAQDIAFRFNELISRLLEADEQIDPREFDLWRGMTAGSTAQGSWQNRKGNVAEELVKGFIRRRVRDRQLLVATSDAGISETLADSRIITYASEPDIAFYDRSEKILIAVEIKGGIDPAGVLERVGAAIKSLSRAKQENPQALTILLMYKVSMTYQTIQELEAHRYDIDRWLTIEDVLNRDEARQALFEFLDI